MLAALVEAADEKTLQDVIAACGMQEVKDDRRGEFVGQIIPSRDSATVAGIPDDELVTINVNGTESSIMFTDDESAYRRLTSSGSSSAASAPISGPEWEGVTITEALLGLKIGLAVSA